MTFDLEVDSLKELLDKTHPGWSVDRLCCHPKQAIFFCELAKRQLGVPRTADDFDILWAMMNDRKSSDRYVDEDDAIEANLPGVPR